MSEFIYLSLSAFIYRESLDEVEQMQMAMFNTNTVNVSNQC